MAIEVKVNGKKEEEKSDYPYLGRANDGEVVLFTEESTGMVINKSACRFGLYCSVWDEDAFTPLSPSESITLSNKA